MKYSLKKLFDFQQFENNEKLASLIEETEKRGGEELPDEFLDVAAAQGSANNVNIKAIMRILQDMGIYESEEFVQKLIDLGGSTLRDWAKSKSGNNSEANQIPIF